MTNVRDDVKFLTENVGVDQRSGISISQDSSWMAVLIFQFALENETPLVLERKDTQILSQHLGKAFQINRFCNHLRQKYQAVLGVLDHMNVGLCVAMESGELLTYNAKARQIFNDQNGLKLDRYGHIEATDHQKTIQLKNTINACCKTASGRNKPLNIHSKLTSSPVQSLIFGSVPFAGRCRQDRNDIYRRDGPYH